MLKNLAMAFAAITLMAAPVASFAQTCGGSKDSKQCCCSPKCECKDCKCADGKCCGKDCKCEKCGPSCECKK